MRSGPEDAPVGRIKGLWPWAALVLLAVPAIWHVVDFPDDRDGEFPAVHRPTFNPLPPPAYRLAEPGDTLDRIAIYLSAAAAGLAIAGGLARWRSTRSLGLWPTALSLALAACWHASTPWPTFDGWHGLGWRVVFDRATPGQIRLGIAMMAVLLLVAGIVPVVRNRRQLGTILADARRVGSFRLAVAAIILVGFRQVDLPGLQPPGYWQRWAFDWGLAAFVMAMIRSWPGWLSLPRPSRLVLGSFGAAAVAGLIFGGIWLTWYHRPLNRMRTVEPGKIYLSAMPTYRGLEVAHARHKFKTIINLFPEVGPLRSPLAPDELRFAEEHGIRYLNSPGDAASSDAFLDLTLALARDPQAWPILVHCHGCMDRSPAWMGIYRFVVQGKPLDAILREIEAHRGYRPKASVTLLYNRVLEPRAPERYAADPTAALLRRCAEGTRDPFFDQMAKANSGQPPRVSRQDTDLRPSDGPSELDTPPAAVRVPVDPAPPAPPSDELPPMTLRIPLSEATERTSPPAISDLMKTALADPRLISLAAGFVDQGSLPVEITARAAASLLADPIEGRRALQYGTTQGDLGLRKRLIERQERSDGKAEGAYADVLPRTVVTTGSAQLLYLIAESLIDPGDIVLVESPTYFVFLGLLESRGARAIGIATDEGGLCLDSLDSTLAAIEARGELERVKLIYTVTEHSNPSGISLAPERRRPLVELARRWSKAQQIYVLEDAAYRGLVFEGQEPPTVWSQDDEGQTVILARSFSKTFSPGIKTGYGILPTALVDPVLRFKGNHDFGSANFNQQLLDRLIADGSCDGHLDGLIAMYRRKRDAMLEALEAEFAGFEGGVSWTVPTGGLFVWFAAPEGIDTGKDGPLFGRCLERGVLYVPGRYAFADEPGPPPTNFARLCFGVPSEPDLREGVRRLAAALADCLAPVV